MKFAYKLGVIGFGNMAGAIVGGAVKRGVVSQSDVCAYDIDAEKVRAARLDAAASLEELARSCEYILLSVKPQNAGGVLSALALQLTEAHKLISIMAGISIAYIKNAVGGKITVVRCMPNLPCLYGAGAAALAFGQAPEDVKRFPTELFAATSTVVEVPEDKINAVTCVSGSGPAYFYYFIKAITECGVKHGLPYETAKRLAVATAAGSARMVEESPDSLDTLIDKVCSKGGTTIEAIRCFDERGLSEIVDEALTRCHDRAKELAGDK